MCSERPLRDVEEVGGGRCRGRMKEEVLNSVWGRAFLPGQAARAGFREDLGGLLPRQTSCPVNGARHLYQSYLNGPCQALKCWVEMGVWQGGQRAGVLHLWGAGRSLVLHTPSPGSGLDTL